MVIYSQHPDLDSGLARKFREGHLELFEDGSFIATNNEQVVKSFELNGEKYVIKRYLENGVRANLRSLLGISRAMNSFKKSAVLIRVGVQTPSHLFVARHLGILRGMSFMVMKKSNGEPLYPMLFEEPLRKISPQLIAKLAEMVQRIHTAGFTHGDLHAGNVFILEDDSVEIIDLDNLGSGNKRQQKDRARLLQSFDLSPLLREELARAFASKL